MNIGEQPRRYVSAFARRRSGVRIPSAPLHKSEGLQVNLVNKEGPYEIPALCDNSTQQRGFEEMNRALKGRTEALPRGADP